MNRFFVPYSGEKPAPIEIKGHRLVIVSDAPDDLMNNLETLGGSSVKEVRLRNEEDTTELAHLAAEVGGGVVIAPPGVSLANVLLELERELPWVH